jgi:hypothetical protein
MTEKSIFRAADLEVIEVGGGNGAARQHLHWRVGIAPTAEADIGGRVVYATLHANDETGGGEVTVGGLILHHPADLELELDAFRAGIDGSDALECFYDAARSALRVVCATVGIQVDVPVKAPSPEFGLLRPREVEDDEIDSSALEAQ